MIITELWAHRFGDRILNDSPEIEELKSGLESIRLPICVGFKRAPFDVKQGLLNKMIDFVFVTDGWVNQPYIDTRDVRESSQQGDFSKTTADGIKIFVEVEFGNIASSFRDLYKFNLAYSLDTYDCGVFILPMRNLAKRIDTIQSFEGAKKLISEARNFINLPLILIGIDSDPVTDLNLLEIRDDVNYWKTYKVSDFDEFILEHRDLLFIH
jgi:HAMP domain-containing protein